jgi:hypothetical protein
MLGNDVKLTKLTAMTPKGRPSYRPIDGEKERSTNSIGSIFAAEILHGKRGNLPIPSSLLRRQEPIT